ncbi:MAG: HIT family protein [Saprospiraceae bacterium]|nr:HIT family protein [Saprospiraceae bacterium]
MPSIFSRIVQGEIPCYKVAETEDYLAFLDVRPQAKGHTLCIPKKEIDYIFDVDDELYAGLWLFAKIVAKALEQEVPCQRIGTAVVGLEVPHAHIHLIPLNSISDLSFGKEPVQMSPDEMSDLAARIAARIRTS